MNIIFKKSVFFTTLLLTCLFLTISSIAQGETAEETTNRLQTRYDHLQSLTFDFLQVTKGQLTGRPKTGRGKAYFVRNRTPGKMRWNYTDPERQVLVSDGKTFSMYFESLKQMIVTPADALQKDITYSFFTGNGKILEDFNVSYAQIPERNTPEEPTILTLTPKKTESQIASIALWVTADALIRRMEIIDQFDTITTLNFSNLEVNRIDLANTKLIKKLFSFVPPLGTEIIRQ